MFIKEMKALEALKLKLFVIANSESLFGITRVEICIMSSLRFHLIDIEEAIKLPVLICSRNMLQNGRGEK